MSAGQNAITLTRTLCLEGTGTVKHKAYISQQDDDNIITITITKNERISI